MSGGLGSVAGKNRFLPFLTENPLSLAEGLLFKWNFDNLACLEEGEGTDLSEAGRPFIVEGDSKGEL